jgi:TATA-binding protein-associated factor Taf7
MYSAKLVDLPCIIEAQKTLNNKRNVRSLIPARSDPLFYL